MLQFGIPELPETISVETRLISREAARLQNLEAFELITNSPINQPIHLRASVNSINFKQLQQTISEERSPTPIPMTVPLTPKETLSPYNAVKTYTETEMNTESPNPMRERCLQTELIKSVSIGIQCNVEEDLDEAVFKKNVQANYKAYLKEVDEIKKRFFDFVKNKARRYENGKFECMLCGEIKPSSKLIASHMAIHWGPPQLCTRCGVHFEHAAYWKTHNCIEKRRTKTQYMKCPYYSCGVNAISPAELYDHLNEHCGLRPHRCSCCKKGFATVGELRLHRKLHKTCLKLPFNDAYKLPKENTLHRRRVLIMKTAQGKKVLVKFSLSQVLKRKNITARYCFVCLKRCRNVVHYQKHTKHCLDKHKLRLKNKQDFIFKAAKTNGVTDKTSS